MSKKAKIIKQKKKFPWGKIFYYFKTLISNDRVMECGLQKKWYWTIILFVFTILVACIPQVVNASQTNGSNNLFVSSVSGDAYYIGLEEYRTSTDAPDLTFENNIANSTKGQSTNPFFTYEYKSQTSLNTKTYKSLMMFYIGDMDFNSTLETIQNNFIGDDLTNPTYKSSYIVFGREWFSAAIYKLGNTKVSSTYGGDYKTLRETFTTAKSFKTILGLDSDSDTTTTLNTQTLMNFKDFLHDGFISTRTNMTWVWFGMTCAINGGLMLLMGLVVFLMTRGKNNPNRKITFLQSYGISTWSSTSPAILSLILGFIIPSYAIMFFVITYGFRVMWMSMRQLRPIQN